jgi:hypothetical protein
MIVMITFEEMRETCEHRDGEICMINKDGLCWMLACPIFPIENFIAELKEYKFGENIG